MQIAKGSCGPAAKRLENGTLQSRLQIKAPQPQGNRIITLPIAALF
jgi:hypothetical protein